MLLTSIHKAKGLDSKAVILIGMPPQQSLASDYEQYTWFMAVSRARQLLAVVESHFSQHSENAMTSSERQ